ncbi:MAG: hypothetical protein A3B86_01775 [Candidatus Yanofskybacteria bacterium RIFCSPHIGHO2_02_FULL_38_22b]|uniref:Antitoxin n=1 Tax=Candidatus Yanofskybacteria bacterium RIFCSPHIGHO2_02_FULL_38_22b TaxID=1802673 RepID=A0A1F8F4D6_9BACT|nr:MAG: hypothetical protein A2816_00675 [Candidatus Yanofskybacteria bacterium RIFCSPHIGHO2_01_FULL_39_44]OGN07119.1 MAG: hypothetical protein A3B86_01775 [Candidatus Yanofskybacteria bacterium RIFCSPHIGHO2_02_FULL_38_22b]OGN19969.1 MAG: hypothetical protein A2910_00485 [Candidatus Yanofskybacteria bacterium RIFCSPLOWO2_01_FULL_39_28]
MDINELKKLIKDSTSVLVLDNGEPSFVILGYDTYKNMAVNVNTEKEVTIKHPTNNGSISSNGRSFHDKETEILDRLNKEILALKSQIEAEEKGLNSPHVD